MGYDRRSRLARALWIEVFDLKFSPVILPSRGSREPCGSKSFHICVFSICNLSRLARALWIEVPYYDNLPRVERSRLARALWIEVTVSGALCRKRCRGSREPCGSKSNQFNPHNNVSRRGSREPCGSKFPSFSNDVHPPVEARESLVDRRVQRSPLLYFFHSRGSREPCGSKVSFSILPVLTGRRGSREPCGSKDLSGVRRCQFMYRSRLARALWIEGFKSSFVFLREASRLARALWIEGFLYLYT